MLRKRKSRMISFRITERDYEDLQTLCSRHGVPTISEMTRAALMRIAEEPGDLDQRLQAVSSRIAALERALARRARVSGSTRRRYS